MGDGHWTTTAYNSYTTTAYGVDSTTFSTMDYSAQEVYTSHKLNKLLNPKNINRLCRDSKEHPYTIPVILALDVTGSMGDASVRVAQKLNEIMTTLYADDSIHDIEFCVMGIGDLAYDRAPIQMSQFESDIRIAEQLDKIYFEAGGGGNSYESYSAAWYMGVNHCTLDCWNRGKKGIIITLGDELPNPYLPKNYLESVTGDSLQGDVDSKELLKEAKEKFDIFHIAVNDNSTSYEWYKDKHDLDKEWKKFIGKNNYFVANLDNLANTIIHIIKNCQTVEEVIFSTPNLTVNNNSEVTW